MMKWHKKISKGKKKTTKQSQWKEQTAAGEHGLEDERQQVLQQAETEERHWKQCRCVCKYGNSNCVSTS